MTTFEQAFEVAQTADLDGVLRLPPADLAALRDALLARTIELVYEGHPHYRRVMTGLGLRPSDIVTTDDLRKLPVTTKHDFLADPDAFRLRVPSLPIEMTALWEVIYTTGTSTGVPAPIYTTTFDHLSYMHAMQRRRPFVPLGPRDLVVSLFPLTPFPMGAYSRAVAEAAACGAAIVPAQTGRRPAYFGAHRSIDEAVELVVTHRATVLWGVAGFVRRLLMQAERTGADFSTVRMVTVTGEASSHALLDDLRRRLDRLGSAQSMVVNRYGSTEQGGAMIECVPGSGFHNLAPDQLFFEVVDPQSGERRPDGETGSLAFTHLLRRGTVLLRYAPGDVASLDRSPCPACGRTSSERLSTNVRRVGTIQKIKGTLVDLDAVRARLESVPELDEFQLVLRSTDPAYPESVDDLLVRFACPDASEEAVRATIELTVGEVGRLRPTVLRCSPIDIFDPETEAKPRRLVDARDPGRPA